MTNQDHTTNKHQLLEEPVEAEQEQQGAEQSALHEPVATEQSVTAVPAAAEHEEAAEAEAEATTTTTAVAPEPTTEHAAEVQLEQAVGEQLHAAASEAQTSTTDEPVPSAVPEEQDQPATNEPLPSAVPEEQDQPATNEPLPSAVPEEQDQQVPQDAPADVQDPVADATDAPVDVQDPVADATDAPAAEDAPATDTQEAPAADDAAAPQEATDSGASYTPVEEDEGSKPRRLKDLEPDMELDGRVTSIALYGIFVDIGVGRDGLVHISEMSDTRIDSPSDMVQIGDVVNVRIKSVDPDARRISLTMRSKERPEGGRSRSRKRPEVDSNRITTLKVGDTVEGTVTGLAPFGAFVDIGVGKDGLVHISELAEGRVDRPEDAVKVGERYTFKLLEVDPEGTRISLSLRKALRGQRMQTLDKGTVLDGTVSGLATFGAFVDIGVGRDGLVHISELSENRVGKVEDAVEVGQKVTVKVLDVDPNSKRISLTMRLEDRPERPALEPGERAAARPERFERPERSDRPAQRPVVDRIVQVAEDEPEEEPKANPTLEDLVSKFGGASATGKRDKRRRPEEGVEEEEDTGDRFTKRQRDAIRRTIQQMGEDE